VTSALRGIPGDATRSAQSVSWMNHSVSDPEISIRIYQLPNFFGFARSRAPLAQNEEDRLKNAVHR